tara:strand:+ start:613 stop:1161 length:549 start_codon:yes stop_codon:yes gene_type:complete
MTSKIDTLDTNLSKISKLKTSIRKLGFSANEFNEITHSQNFEKALEQKVYEKLRNEMEGKCVGDGFILNKSLKLKKKSNIYFPLEALQLFYTLDVEFEFIICNPNPGVRLNCRIVSKSKIGLVAKLESDLSPLLILIPNDLYNTEKNSKEIKENDEISVEVTGKKFEQNDKKITVIAKYIPE